MKSLVFPAFKDHEFLTSMCEKVVMPVKDGKIKGSLKRINSTTTALLSPDGCSTAAVLPAEYRGLRLARNMRGNWNIPKRELK